jgi:TonB-linked SusC/RagA family outer membrane protein
MLLVFVFAITVSSNSWAQERSVSGKVTAIGDGSPIPGVNVVIKGTTTGTISDHNGNYELKIADGAILVFSFIGYVSEEVEVGARSVIDLQLSADVRQLSEVVVVAYGEESKRKLTGSIGSIDSKSIGKQQITTIGRALQGTVAGVSVIQQSGSPGDNPIIRIRGIASIDSGNDPLIVVDGAVFSSNLNTINPNDIESMSVLKDASSAALYGARAANGVILITTKTGKVGKPEITFNMTTGVSDRARKDYEYLSAKDQMLLEWEALRNDGVDQGSTSPGQDASDGLIGRVGYNPFGNVPEPINANGEFAAENTLWDTDWENAIFTSKAIRTDYNLGISGGTEDVKYYIGGSILDQEGAVQKSDFKRYSGRVNLDAELNDWLSIGLRQNIVFSEQNNPPQSGTSFSNNIQWIRTVSPIYPVFRRDENGDFILDGEGNKIYDTGDFGIGVNTERVPLSSANAVGQTLLNEDLRKRFSSMSNIYFQFNFLNDFNFKTSYTLNKYVFDRFVFTNQAFGSAKSVKGRITRNKDITTEWTATNSLNWNKDFNEHNLDVLLLQEAYNFTIERENVSKTGLPFDGLFELNSAAALETIGGSKDSERISSVMGRVKYDYQGKYLFSASFRQDESSRFGADFRKGNFFSISGGWNISDEAFMSGLGAIDFLKLRASYGEIGNSNILSDPNQDGVFTQEYFPYLAVFNTGFDQPGFSGVYTAGVFNPALTWEAVATTNVGVDFSLFKNRLNGSIDAYRAVTKDLVTAATTTISRGIRFGSITSNVGDITNSGVEVVLGGDVFKAGAFTWNLSFNIAFEDNEITKFPEGERINGSKKLEEGRSIFDFFIREWAGVDPNTGQPLWNMDVLDTDGETVIDKVTTNDYDAATRYFVGSALPDARGGMTSSLFYKGLDFSFLVNFALGGKVLDSDYQGLLHGGRRAGNNYSVDAINRWQQPGDITDYPRQSSDDRGNSRSTRFLFDATYARLRNVTIGYTLPNKLIEKTEVVQSLRVFVAGDNLITLFGRDGLDPEQAVNGLTDNRSSSLQTFSAGVEVKF